MTDKEKKSKEEHEWNKKAKEIWLAGLGALSAVEEEGSKLFRTLVDRGSEFEKKRKDQIDEMWEQVNSRYKDVESRVGEKFDKAEERMEKNIKSMVSGLGIPTRNEVDELSNKVDALIAKLEKLEKKESGSGGKGAGKTGKSGASDKKSS
ncbi:phasin family protein [Balneolales bacterium ANBcel1]|nr:phasin family protein [Balneolales bacterium ANBcel1]